MIRAKKSNLFSETQLAELAALEESSLGDAGGAPQPADTLMQEIYSFGSFPCHRKGTSEAAQEENTLWRRMIRAKNSNILSGAQLADLTALEDSSPEDSVGALQPADTLMQEIRSLGRLPRRVQATSEATREETTLLAA